MGGFTSIPLLGNLLNSAPGIGLLLGNGFRPPQWAGPQLTSITVSSSVVVQPSSAQGVIVFNGQTLPGSPGNLVPGSTTSKSTTYFFDAVLSADHVQEMRSTEHPVQNGSSFTDHAYRQSARVTLEIGMSDAMDSFISGQYSGPTATKSVSAYQTFKNLQQSRTPLQLTTRLDTYANMLVETIRVHDDIRTLHGLRASITFKEIILANVNTTTQSARPNQSQGSTQGTTQTQNVPPELEKYLNPISGQWSSNTKP